MIQIWSCLSIDAGELRHQGNRGYQDILGEVYTWDNTVPNHKVVAHGDLLVLRDRDFVLGCGWIDGIELGEGTKSRLRCPGCRTTQFDRRKNMATTFRCSRCKSEFDVPIVEEINVSTYAAVYDRTWRPIDELVSVKSLDGFYLNRSAQQSIRRLSLDAIRGPLNEWAHLSDLWWQADGGIRPGGHRLVLQGSRIGQTEFRASLIRRFGHVCAITGPQPIEVLDAAHLYRYAETPHHDLHGGLLLRRDLHTLFDRRLLAIDTTNWTVVLAPRIRRIHADYSKLHGKSLRVQSDRRPHRHYLDTHRMQASALWSQMRPMPYDD